METIDKKYDDKLKVNLENLLKRPAKPNEIINADSDANLVNETLWQLIVELTTRVELLEKKP